MAVVPLPGSQLTATIGRPEAIEGTIPAAVRSLLESLWSNGQAAYVVGGSLRDVVLGRLPADWDLASDALPERVVPLAVVAIGVALPTDRIPEGHPATRLPARDRRPLSELGGPLKIGQVAGQQAS